MLRYESVETKRALEEVVDIYRHRTSLSFNYLQQKLDKDVIRYIHKIPQQSYICPQIKNTHKYCQKITTHNMGKGVRAIKHIPKNTPIGCYMGTVKHQSEIRKSDDWRYNFFYALKDYTIDGSNCDSIMSLINHSDKPNIQVSHHLHSIGNPSKPVEEVHIVFITKTDIEPYTELFIDYGEDYWKASKLMGINKQIEQPNTHKQKLITDYFIKKRLRDYETSPNKITKT